MAVILFNHPAAGSSCPLHSSDETYEIDDTDIDGDFDSHTVRAALIWNFGGL